MDTSKSAGLISRVIGVQGVSMLLLLGLLLGNSAASTLLVGKDTNQLLGEFTTTGTFIQNWGVIGRSTGAAVDGSGNVYITNPSFGNNIIEKQSPTNVALGTITATVNGQWIEDLGNFTGNFLLAGTFEGSIFKIDITNGSHTLLFATGFSFTGVTYDGTNIWATGGLANNNVYKYDLAGNVLATCSTGQNNGGIGYDATDGTLYIGHFNGLVTHNSLNCTQLGSFTVAGFSGFVDGLEVRGATTQTRVPEPGTFLLLASGLAAIIIRRRINL